MIGQMLLLHCWKPSHTARWADHNKLDLEQLLYAVLVIELCHGIHGVHDLSAAYLSDGAAE